MPEHFDFSMQGRTRWRKRHAISDTGTTRIEDDNLCIEFSSLTRGREVCYAIFRNADGYRPGKDYDYIMVDPGYYYFSLAE